jgi:hypothetical protein
MNPHPTTRVFLLLREVSRAADEGVDASRTRLRISSALRADRSALSYDKHDVRPRSFSHVL